MPIYAYAGHKPEISEKAFVHPQAVIMGDISIGPYCYIAAGAVLRGDFGKIIIGKGSNVQENAIIHAKPGTVADIREQVLIAHGAIVHGPCIIKAHAGIGMGGIVAPDCIMEESSFLAAGSLLKSKTIVASKMLAVGRPAVIKKELSPRVVELNRQSVANYMRLSQEIKKDLILLS